MDGQTNKYISNSTAPIIYICFMQVQGCQLLQSLLRETWPRNCRIFCLVLDYRTGKTKKKEKIAKNLFFS